MDSVDFSIMNETDVREIIIRPLLGRLGYKHGTEATIRTEITLRYSKAFLGRKKKKDPPLTGKADYICDYIPYGRIVVEAKSPSGKITQDAVEQAHTYAAHPEVCADFFILCNGLEWRIYETG